MTTCCPCAAAQPGAVCVSQRLHPADPNPTAPEAGPQRSRRKWVFQKRWGSPTPSPSASGRGGGLGSTVHAYSQQCLFPRRRHDPAPGRCVPKDAVSRASSVSQGDTSLCREDRMGVFVGYKKPVKEQGTGWDAVATGGSTGSDGDMAGALDTSDLWPSEHDAERMFPACAGPAWTDFPCPPAPLLPPSPNLRTDGGHHRPKTQGESWLRVPGCGAAGRGPAELRGEWAPPWAWTRTRGFHGDRRESARPERTRRPPAASAGAAASLLCRCLRGRHLLSDRHVGEGSACCLRHV